MEKIKSHSESYVSLQESIRSGIISVAWKLFHILFGNDRSLEKTGEQYLKKTGTQLILDEHSKWDIEALKNFGKGIIIANHPSGVFSDYLPLLSALGDDILKKTIFYTGRRNLKMNQKEFPNYDFRAATNLGKNGLEILKKDIEKVNSTWWFLFIIPSGADTSQEAPFQGIFKRIIAYSEEKLPVLTCKVEHDSPKGYPQIAKAYLSKSGGISKVKTSMTKVKDWENKNKKEMGEFYRGEAFENGVTTVQLSK